MKLIRYVILCLSGLLVQQSVNAQVKLMSSITTNSPDDTYPTHMDSLGKGGFMAVPTKAIRDKLSTQRRKVGMMVYVSETDSVYQLKGDTTNAHWVSFKLASAMGWQGTQTSHPGNPQLNWAYYNSTDRKSYIYDGNNWQIFAQDGAGSSTTFNGNRPITLGLSPFVNVNPGTNDVAEWIQKVFYPSQGPTAGLTMSFVNPANGSTVTSSPATLEMMAAGANIPITLNWTAGRDANTEPLATVTLAGVSQTFSQPAQGASTTGSMSASFGRNAFVSFINYVSTSDGKNASSTVSISFSWKRYSGFMTLPSGSANYTPTSSDILALSNQAFSSSRAHISPSLTPTGEQHLIIAYPLAWDPGPSTAAKIWIGGLESSGNFIRRTIDFTNQSGGNTTYVVYILTNKTSGEISYRVE